MSKCSTIGDKTSADANIEVNREPLYNKFFYNYQTKLYGDEVTNYSDNEKPKVDSSYNCLAKISLDFFLGVDEHLQVFLKECK